MKSAIVRLAAAAALALALLPVARAEVWGSVGGKGAAHFAGQADTASD